MKGPCPRCLGGAVQQLEDGRLSCVVVGCDWDSFESELEIRSARRALASDFSTPDNQDAPRKSLPLAVEIAIAHHTEHHKTIDGIKLIQVKGYIRQRDEARAELADLRLTLASLSAGDDVDLIRQLAERTRNKGQLRKRAEAAEGALELIRESFKHLDRGEWSTYYNLKKVIEVVP